MSVENDLLDRSDSEESEDDPVDPVGATEGSDAEVLRDLDAEETEKLVQLRDMIGIDDVAVCRALLESKGWDLEATAREQLGIPQDHRQEAEEDRRRRELDRPLQEAHNVRVIRAAGPREAVGRGLLGIIVDWGFYLFSLPIVLPFRLAQSLFGFLSHTLGFRALPDPRRNGNVPLNPLQDVKDFVDSFKRVYSVTNADAVPDFRPVTYSQALDEAKRDLRFLLVYLHSQDHQDTAAFCRDTLCHRTFLDFVSSHEMLVWGCSVDSGEGHRVSQAMRESTYPFLAAIVLRQNRMMMVGRIEGACPPLQLTRKLEEIVRDNEAYIVAARVDREERNLTQTIRAEQDAAFQETLRQDQEKEQKKREAEEEKRRQEEAERQLLREEQERRDRIRQMKIDLVSEIPAEPEPEDPGVLRILIKLPGGQRLERRFLKSQSLKYLYYFVFCHPDSPDEFDITTNFPKKVLRCKPDEEPLTFEQSGIGQSTMLFVHDLEA